jgi:hypothetical protein
VLPAPLLQALRHVFAQRLSGCMLVGGTALAGFYAGHRRSDDLDLFTGSATAFTETVLAVRTLRSRGVELHETAHSEQYYRAVCHHQELAFTVDVVCDEHVFGITKTNRAGDVVVAGLSGLLAMKAATLVSRCSEKDLYDLIWLCNAFPERTFPELIELARTVDGGVTGETLVYSIGSTTLERDACGFAAEFGVSAAAVFRRVTGFQRDLLSALDRHLTSGATNSLRDLVKRIGNL